MPDTVYSIDFQKVTQELLRNKERANHQKTYRSRAFHPRIKQSLRQLSNYDYDFLYSSSSEIWIKLIKDNIKTKNSIPILNFRTSCYLKMECQYCEDRKKGLLKKRRWETEIGTFQIQYALIPFKDLIRIQRPKKKIISPENNFYLLLFRCKAYKMKCQRCNQWGQVMVNQTVLKAIEQLFCKSVCDMIDNNENSSFWTRPKINIRSHKSDLCQACKQGICLQISQKN